MHVLEAGDGVTQLRFLPDGRRLLAAVASEDGRAGIDVWTLPQGDRLRLPLPTPGKWGDVNAVAIHPSGESCYVAWDGRLLAFRTDDGTPLPVPDVEAHQVIVSPSGDRLVVARFQYGDHSVSAIETNADGGSRTVAGGWGGDGGDGGGINIAAWKSITIPEGAGIVSNGGAGDTNNSTGGDDGRGGKITVRTTQPGGHITIDGIVMAQGGFNRDGPSRITYYPGYGGDMSIRSAENLTLTSGKGFVNNQGGYPALLNPTTTGSFAVNGGNGGKIELTSTESGSATSVWISIAGPSSATASSPAVPRFSSFSAITTEAPSRRKRFA